MYSVVKQFLEKLDQNSDEPIEFSRQDKRVAMAVLLYRVIRVDGRVRPEEINRYHEILEDNLGVTPDEMDLFEKTVEREAQNENSLFPFTLIVSKMSRGTKLDILKLMNEISVSDNELHEFELNLVARTAELLDVDPKDIPK